MKVPKEIAKRLIGDGKPLTTEEMQRPPKKAVGSGTIHDGDVVQFPEKVELMTMTINGNTAIFCIAKINGNYGRFFLSNLMNVPLSVSFKGTAAECSQMPNPTGSEKFLPEKYGNTGEVIADFQGEKTLAEGVKKIQNKTIQFTELFWVITAFQKKAVFEVTYK